MDTVIFVFGAVITAIPLFILPSAIKEAKGGQPAITYIKDETGLVKGVEKTTTPKRPFYAVPLGQAYIVAQLLAGGFGIAMMIDAFS